MLQQITSGLLQIPIECMTYISLEIRGLFDVIQSWFESLLFALHIFFAFIRK